MYICNKCNKEFTYKNSYNRHLIKKIPCDNIIKCNNCLTIFKTNQILNNHKNRKNNCIKVDLNQKNIELEHENKLLKLELEINKLKNENNTLKQKESKISQPKENNKIGIVYILSSLLYQLQDIYKVGYSSNTMKVRLAGYYTTGHIESMKLKYIYKLETEHYKELENLIFQYLKKYKINNEMYKIDLKKLKNIIEKLNSKLILENEIMNLDL